MPDTGETHFGFQTVDLDRQAGDGRRGLPPGRAPLRPDERPHVRRAASRLEGRDGDHAEPAARAAATPSSTSPAAPATSPSGSPRPAAPAPPSPSATSTPTCSRSGASGREQRGLDGVVTFTAGNAEALPFPDRSQDACTIAFGIRNVPRIDVALREFYRVLRPGGRFLCLEFSTVDVPGLDALYDLYSFNVIPALGRAVAGDADSYRYLVEFDPPLSAPAGLRRHDRGGGLPPRELPPAHRRRGGAAFRLAAVSRSSVQP